MPTNPMASAGRAITAPWRGYLNDQFELVKDEVRQQTSAQTTQLHQAIAATLEESVISRLEEAKEQAAVAVAATGDHTRRLTALEGAVVELQRTNDQLLSIIADLVQRPDGRPPVEETSG
jgi:hypothetical protein